MIRRAQSIGLINFGNQLSISMGTNRRKRDEIERIKMALNNWTWTGGSNLFLSLSSDFQKRDPTSAVQIDVESDITNKTALNDAFECFVNGPFRRWWTVSPRIDGGHHQVSKANKHTAVSLSKSRDPLTVKLEIATEFDSSDFDDAFTLWVIASVNVCCAKWSNKKQANQRKSKLFLSFARKSTNELEQQTSILIRRENEKSFLYYELYFFPSFKMKTRVNFKKREWKMKIHLE